MNNSFQSNTMHKYIKNDFHFLHLEKYKHLFKFNIYYVEDTLIYIQIINLNKISWDEDLILRLYDIENKDIFEDLSIGGCHEDMKEIELYTTVQLDYIKHKNKKYIPNSIIQLKTQDTFEINKIYEFYYFIYKNNHYHYKNVNLNDLVEGIKKKYTFILDHLNYLLNENIKIFIIILLYLNLNGGIFISEYIHGLSSIDDLNIDENACLLKDNYVYLIFSKINFLDIDKLVDDLEQKKKIDFRLYLKEFKNIECDQFNIIKNNLNLHERYYTGIFKLNTHDFYIYSKRNHEYEIEELENNYFSLTSDKSDIEPDLELEIHTKNTDIPKKIKFNSKMIKFKTQNNYIFKI